MDETPPTTSLQTPYYLHPLQPDSFRILTFAKSAKPILQRIYSKLNRTYVYLLALSG